MSKITITEKKETKVFDFNFNDECVKDLNDRLEVRVKALNADLKASIIDKKTYQERLDKLTFDKIAYDFVKKIVNALNSTIILCDKKYTINKREIKTDGKRINGRVLSQEVEDNLKEINEFLTTGKVKLTEINPKSPCKIRNAKYVYGKAEKNYIVHEFISMSNFNTLDKETKSKIDASKHILFDNITVVNQ